MASSKKKINTILLVEDDPAEIAMAEQACALCQPAVKLVVMPDSEEALEWLSQKMEEKQPLPKLILVDLKLPKLIGLAVLRKLRMDRRTWDMPIVVFSAVYESSDVVLSYQVGANSFVGKPTDTAGFQSLLQELVSYWFQPRQQQLALAGS
ncbi:MAG: response regulator [Sideroxydans sp.]|nr:response regulator [Sideroxydans sp.]